MSISELRCQRSPVRAEWRKIHSLTQRSAYIREAGIADVEIENGFRRKGNRVTQGKLVRDGVLGAAVGAYKFEGAERKRQDVVTRVPAEQPLFLAQIEINTLVELVDIAAAAKVFNEVVCFSSLSRQREVT